MQVVEQAESLWLQLGENDEKRSDDPEKPGEEKKAQGSAPLPSWRYRAAPVTGVPVSMTSEGGRV